MVQINGKVRTAPMTDACRIWTKCNWLRRCAGRRDSVQELIAGKTVVKVIAVPGKLVNIVVK